jgi:hypothetical protein
MHAPHAQAGAAKRQATATPEAQDAPNELSVVWGMLAAPAGGAAAHEGDESEESESEEGAQHDGGDAASAAAAAAAAAGADSPDGSDDDVRTPYAPVRPALQQRHPHSSALPSSAVQQQSAPTPAQQQQQQHSPAAPPAAASYGPHLPLNAHQQQLLLRAASWFIKCIDGGVWRGCAGQSLTRTSATSSISRASSRVRGRLGGAQRVCAPCAIAGCERRGRPASCQLLHAQFQRSQLCSTIQQPLHQQSWSNASNTQVSSSSRGLFWPLDARIAPQLPRLRSSGVCLGIARAITPLCSVPHRACWCWWGRSTPWCWPQPAADGVRSILTTTWAYAAPSTEQLLSRTLRDGVAHQPGARPACAS